MTRDIDKLGYKGIETCEVVLEECRVPADNLVGGNEGAGLRHVMTGLEAERINVAARGVGVGRAALEQAIAYAQMRQTFGKPIAEHQAIQLLLADMATKIEAARQLTRFAADKKDRGERCDLEAGMAKLFATETAQQVSMDAMRVLGANGYSTRLSGRKVLSRRAAAHHRGRHQRNSEARDRSGVASQEQHLRELELRTEN